MEQEKVKEETAQEEKVVKNKKEEKVEGVEAERLDRMRGELEELGLRLRKLEVFFDSAIYGGLSVDEMVRLRLQYSFMEAYSAVLQDRIHNFK